MRLRTYFGFVLVPLLSLFFLASFFGDNVRALFGSSADSIAGSETFHAADFGGRAEALIGYHYETQHRATGERYTDYGVNPATEAKADRFSTFAVDVDTGAYTLARRKIMEGTLPHPQAVRVEEFLNYFRYDYPSPDDMPFAVHMDAAPSPFSEGRWVMRVGLQAREVAPYDRLPAHLVFLVDVSGSMRSEDKLPLAKKALRLLVDNLGERDTVSLVTYAGDVRVALEPTGLVQKGVIHEAIESLGAYGSTGMASGLELAYQMAAKTLGPRSMSRVIVLSDGDANVGPTRHEDLLALIRGQVEEGVTLTTVGFGAGNYNETAMEQLANKGNGNYFYCDSLLEARRVFQEQVGGTLEVVAKDVKVQVEFDPSIVRSYRLVGYENREVADKDFRNDRVDAGEIGSGHSVTALYEVELVDERASAPPATVRIRAKAPRGEEASEWSFPFEARARYASMSRAPADLQFATAVAGAAERLRGSAYAAGWDMAHIRRLACESTQGRPDREEFCGLLGRVASLERL